MFEGKKLLRRLAMPLGLCLLAATTFMGCQAEIEIRRGRYYSDRVWHSDPYCRYGRYYGCGYDRDDGFRIRLIERRRWRRGWRHITPETADKPATWQSEFALNNHAVGLLKNSFDNALKGETQQLQALGISHGDIKAMTRFELPSDRSIATAAKVMRVKKQDLKDFLEVFLIRMKAAFAANE